MKKLFLSLALMLVAATAAMAQSFDLRIEAAPLFNVSKTTGTGISDLWASRTSVGYRAAVGVDINLSKGLYLNTGLTATMKGNILEGAVSGKEGQVTNQIHYLQIPINVGYKYMLTRTMGVGVQAGPYFSYALGGKTKGGLAGAKESYDIFKAGILGLQPRRFDMGIGIQAQGYMMGFYLMAGADLGLINTLQNKEASADGTIKGWIDSMIQSATNAKMNNTAFYVGVGYTF